MPRVPQFSDNVKLLKMNYPHEFEELMCIFRGVIQSGEISKRVYDLTTEIIQSNPAIYEAWVIRRKCLDKFDSLDLFKELEWTSKRILHSIKNYQGWHHRKLIIEKLNTVKYEKSFLNQVLEIDHKNFLSWSHRIWMIRRFNNIEGEFEFIEKMLQDDIKNNSVWTYRSFLILYINNNKIDKETLKQEIMFAINKIKICQNNESPYNFIFGYIKKFGYKFNEFQDLKNQLKNIFDDNKENYFALSLLMEFYEEENDKEKFYNAIDTLEKIDYIRKKYYLWRKKQFDDRNSNSSNDKN